MPLPVPTNAQKIIDASLTPGLIADREGTILCVNASFVDTYDLDNAGNAVGRNVQEFLHNTESFNEVLDVILEQGRWSGQLLAKKGDELFFLSARAQRIDPEEGEPCIVGFGTISLSVPSSPDGSPLAEDRPLGTAALIGDGSALDEIDQQLRRDGLGSKRLSVSSATTAVARCEDWDVAVVEVPLRHSEAAVSLLAELCARPGRPRTLCVHPDLPAETALRLMRIGPDAFCHLPEEAPEALAAIRRLMRAARFHRFAQSTSRVLRNWLDGSAAWIDLAEPTPAGDLSANCQWYVEYAHAQIHRVLGNVRQLTSELLGGEQDLEACAFFQCPRLDQLVAMTEHTISILEKTRKAFKSKELATLRKDLEAMLKNLKENELS